MIKLGMAMLTETPTATMVVTPRFLEIWIQIGATHGPNTVEPSDHQIGGFRPKLREERSAFAARRQIVGQQPGVMSAWKGLRDQVPIYRDELHDVRALTLTFPATHRPCAGSGGFSRSVSSTAFVIKENPLGFRPAIDRG